MFSKLDNTQMCIKKLQDKQQQEESQAVFLFYAMQTANHNPVDSEQITDIFSTNKGRYWRYQTIFCPTINRI